eukprot:245851-Chlamydomonas_euryale.AAC.1
MKRKPAMLPRQRPPTTAAMRAPLPKPASTHRVHMRAYGDVAAASSTLQLTEGTQDGENVGDLRAA